MHVLVTGANGHVGYNLCHALVERGHRVRASVRNAEDPAKTAPVRALGVAEVVGLHETTVSRAVAGTHMQTPSGIFELKYFFTPGLKTAEGGDISNTTVKEIVANVVASEDPAKPFSDQEILELVRQKGIQIARMFMKSAHAQAAQDRGSDEQR